MKQTTILVNSNDVKVVRERLEELRYIRKDMLCGTFKSELDKGKKLREVDYLIKLNESLIKGTK